MHRPTPALFRRAALCAALLASLLCSGCASVIIGTAVGVVTTGAGLAVDATVGAAKLTGKAVGAVFGSGASERDGP
ncbi:MAG: hypothetical protein ACAH21_14375 [Ramlibacter sp.]